MVGGATSVIGSFSPDAAVPPRNECDAGLARNLDFASGLYTASVNAEPVRYNVFPLELPDADNQAVLKALDAKTIKAYIVHLAEGADARNASTLGNMALLLPTSCISPRAPMQALAANLRYSRRVVYYVLAL
jgi:hypothetical protein